MKLIFGSKKRGKVLIKLVLVLFMAYLVSVIVSQRVLIFDKQKKLDELKNQLRVQELKVGDMRDELDSIKSSDHKFLQGTGNKDFNSLKRGERIFINVKGN